MNNFVLGNFSLQHSFSGMAGKINGRFFHSIYYTKNPKVGRASECQERDNLHFGKMQLREITIRTSTGCPGTMEKALSLLESGKVKVEPAITHVFSAEEMLAAFQTLTTKDPGHVKSLVEF